MENNRADEMKQASENRSKLEEEKECARKEEKSAQEVASSAQRLPVCESTATQVAQEIKVLKKRREQVQAEYQVRHIALAQLRCDICDMLVLQETLQAQTRAKLALAEAEDASQGQEEEVRLPAISTRRSAPHHLSRDR